MQFAFAQSHSLSTKEPYKILIDPGHGGSDPGAIRNNAVEADINLSVSKMLYALLNQHSEIKAFLTRDSDVYLQLQDRIELIQKLKADLFISIHANTSFNKNLKGVEFYFQNQLPPDQEALLIANRENQLIQGQSQPRWIIEHSNLKNKEVTSIINDLYNFHRMKRSLDLCKILLKHWTGYRHSKAKTILQAPFYLVIEADTPSVLVEIGYLSNTSDRKALQSRQYQKNIAKSLFEGLIEFKKQYGEIHNQTQATFVQAKNNGQEENTVLD